MSEDYMAPRVYTVELTYLGETLKVRVTATTEAEAIDRAKKACPAMVKEKIIDVYNVRGNK